MENAEEIMHSLEEFSKMKPKDIPRELNDYLGYVAKTGDPVFKWSIIKCLFREKLLNVITDFYESTLSIELPPCPNVDVFNYERMKANLLERIDSFKGAPFTVQRISELLTNPRKEYNRADKFMRAIEKNILVVSTREPGRNAETETELQLDPSYNGLPYPKESIYDSICNDLSDPDSSGSYEAVVNSDPLKNETENVETQTVDTKDDDKPVQEVKLESTQEEEKDPETVICSTMTLQQEMQETNEVSETDRCQPEPEILTETPPIPLIKSGIEPERVTEIEPTPQIEKEVNNLEVSASEPISESEVILDCSIHDEINSLVDTIELADPKTEENSPKPEMTEDKVVSSTDMIEVSDTDPKIGIAMEEENIEQPKEVAMEPDQTTETKVCEADENLQLEADDNSQREADENSQSEADENSQRESDENSQREADENSQREADENSQSEADENSQREANENSQREADENSQREDSVIHTTSNELVEAMEVQECQTTTPVADQSNS